ncbi:MAG: tRNA (adenosine(37)-N6)-threonylcarbamoyltransferase complex ATPase subunit type 1 TsaE [Cyanobacteria bacterium P01_F01_bin.150]
MYSDHHDSSVDLSAFSTPKQGDRASTVTYFLADAHETHALGVLLGRSLPPGTNLLLYGNLGSGKTTLVQGLGHGLGISDSIVSPTFTLINEYLEGRIPLYHFDLYRLTESAATLLTPDIYWEGVDYDPGIVVIEWAERLEFDPPQCLKVEFSFTPNPADADDIGRSVTLSIVEPEQVNPDLIDILAAMANNTPDFTGHQV